MTIKNQIMIIGDSMLRKNLFGAFREEGVKNLHLPPDKPVTIENDGTLILRTHSGSAHEHTFEGKNFMLRHAAPQAILDEKDLSIPYLTLLVCVTPDNYELCKQQIDEILKLRTNPNNDQLYFNIFPICTDEVACKPILTQLQENFPHLYRSPLQVDIKANDFNFVLRTSLAISEATVIYAKILHTAVYLSKLKKCLNENQIKDFDSSIDNLSEILVLASDKRIGQDENNLLKKYFDVNKNKITQILLELNQQLPNKSNYDKRAKHIFLNIVKTIGIIFSLLSIVGLPFAYKQMTQNLKKHNSFFKFEATNEAEEIQGQISKIEDSINFTPK